MKKQRKRSQYQLVQGGFMEERGCMEQVWVLRQLGDYYYSLKKPLFVAFLDIKKAYDSVPHSRIIYKLMKSHVAAYTTHDYLC